MSDKKFVHRLTFSAVVTLLSVAGFLYFVPIAEMRKNLGGIEPRWQYLPPFFVSVAMNLYLRSATLALLINSATPVPRYRWMAVAAGHNLGTSLSGLIMGDAILLGILNRLGIHWKQSLFVTLIARLFELMPLILMLFLGLMATESTFDTQGVWSVLSGLAFIVGTASLFVLGPVSQALSTSKWLARDNKLAKFSQAYCALTDRCMTRLLLLSAGKIFCAFLFFFFAMKFFAIRISLAETLLVFGIFNFATIIPVQGVMGIGTFEAYFSIGLVLLGVAVSTALVQAFLVHILFLVSFLVIALLAFLPVLFERKTLSGR